MLGTPVVGNEFFDRRELIEDLKRTIPHAHHALIGPRGCGKSSILMQLSEMEKVDELTPVYIDVGRVIPRTQLDVMKKLGKEALYAAVSKRGLIRSLPALARTEMAKVTEFVRENLRVRIGDWITLYFEPAPNLTELMEETFSTIESYGVELLVMLDEFTSLVRLSGPQPKKEDMDFVEALRGHISEARKAHYILSGSHVGLMNLVVKAKFGRMLILKEVGGLEESGADDLIRSKVGKISDEFATEIKSRTRLWPLYLQAFCLAINLRGKSADVNEVERTAFDLLAGHFLYLENQLGEMELMALLVLDSGKVSEVTSKLGVGYPTLNSIFRTLELKGFVKKVSPGVYESIDPMLSKWLKQRYEIR